MKTNAFLYSSKVWLTVVFVAPFVQCIIDLLHNKDTPVGFWVFFSISIGAVLAAPSLILFWLTMLCIKKVAFNDILMKLCLSIAGLLLAILLLYLAYNLQQFTADGEYLPIPYMVIAISAIWLYELPILNNKQYLEEVNS